MLKYLMLVIAVGAGYEGYTNWATLQPMVARARTTLLGAPVPSAKVAAAQVAVATLPEFRSANDPAAPAANQPSASAGNPTLTSVALSVPPAAAQGVPAASTVPLAARVAEAQRQAIARYPALGVANSEMNLRFVFRYNRLVTEHSSRLLDPAWPLQLADECAVSAGVKPAGATVSRGSVATTQKVR